MRVKCMIEEVELENDDGAEVPGIQATCGRCNHETTSFGQHEGSIKRCLVLMREECPEGENNFYVEES